MTPEDIHAITFARAPFGCTGYREQDIDELLDLIAAALAGRATLTSEHLQRGFRAPPGVLQRGYHPIRWTPSWTGYAASSASDPHPGRPDQR